MPAPGDVLHMVSASCASVRLPVSGENAHPGHGVPVTRRAEEERTGNISPPWNPRRCVEASCPVTSLYWRKPGFGPCVSETGVTRVDALRSLCSDVDSVRDRNRRIRCCPATSDASHGATFQTDTDGTYRLIVKVLFTFVQDRLFISTPWLYSKTTGSLQHHARGCMPCLQPSSGGPWAAATKGKSAWLKENTDRYWWVFASCCVQKSQQHC